MLLKKNSISYSVIGEKEAVRPAATYIIVPNLQERSRFFMVSQLVHRVAQNIK